MSLCVLLLVFRLQWVIREALSTTEQYDKHMTRHEELSCLLSCQKRRIYRIDPQGWLCPMMGDGVGLLIATSNSEGLHNILSHLKIYVDYPLCYSLISVISLIRQLLLIPQNLLSRSVKDTKDGFAHPIIPVSL